MLRSPYRRCRRTTKVAGLLSALSVTCVGLSQPAWAADAANPGFEDGLTGWGAVKGTTATVVQAPVHAGSNAVSLQRETSKGAATLTDRPNQLIDIPAGTVCTASAWAIGPLGYKARVRWVARNGGKNVAMASETVLFDGSWQRLPTASLTMPSTASTADLQLSGLALPPGRTWTVDDVEATCDVDSTPPPPPGGTDLGRWGLDEIGSDTASDSSGNSNHGTNYNVVGNGTGYAFNGESSRVVVPASGSLNPGTADFAYSATFVTETPAIRDDTFDLIRKGVTDTPGGEFKLEIRNVDGKAKAVCTLKDADRNRASIRGTTNLDDGKVHTATCIKTATGLTVQVDDLAPRTATVPALRSVANTYPVLIGAKPGEGGDWLPGDDWFLGTMYEASIRTL